MNPAPRRQAVPKADAIQLWMRAYGLCSYQGCGRELVIGSSSPRLRGHMAHIVAHSEDGPRGDPGVPEGDRNRYPNLILLCPNHHEEIDSEHERYDAAALRTMKQEHEESVARQLDRGSTWQKDLSTLDYVNVPRLLIDPASRGALSMRDIEALTSLTTLRDQGLRLVGIMLAFEEVFKSWNAKAVGLAVLDELGPAAVGARVSFDETFRTKNMTGREKQQPGFELSGDLERDPHLYVTKGDRTIYLPLDPRWVTTSTGFVTFTSGISRLTGLGLLRAVDDASAIISPLAIGAPPLSGWNKTFEDGLAV
jgi:hypothetical protein